MVDEVSFVIFFIGLYALVVKRNAIKSIIALVIMETAVILYFIAGGFREGMLPPIGDVLPEQMVDPLPQALMITAIVIGIASTAVALVMYIHLRYKYGTDEWKEVMKKRIEEDG
ncbi:MAG: cation:proton antiporter subunit C [Atribacterota bacterium]